MRATLGIGITEYFTGPPQVPLTAAQYKRQRDGDLQRPRIRGCPELFCRHGWIWFSPNTRPGLIRSLVTTYPSACRNRHIDALCAQAGLPVYAYEFNDQNAPYYLPAMPDFTPAAHTIDI